MNPADDPKSGPVDQLEHNQHGQRKELLRIFVFNLVLGAVVLAGSTALFLWLIRGLGSD